MTRTTEVGGRLGRGEDTRSSLMKNCIRLRETHVLNCREDARPCPMGEKIWLSSAGAAGAVHMSWGHRMGLTAPHFQQSRTPLRNSGRALPAHGSAPTPQRDTTHTPSSREGQRTVGREVEHAQPSPTWR